MTKFFCLALLSFVITTTSASADCYGLSYQLHAQTADGKDLKCSNAFLESSIGTFDTEQSAINSLHMAAAKFASQEKLSCDIITTYEDKTDYTNAKAVWVTLSLDTLGKGSIDGDDCDTVYSYKGIYTYNFVTERPVTINVNRGSRPLTAEEWKALNNQEPDNR